MFIPSKRDPLTPAEASGPINCGRATNARRMDSHGNVADWKAMEHHLEDQGMCVRRGLPFAPDL